MGRMDGWVALITGAASGIGSACALRLAEEGARIAGLDVSDAEDESWHQATQLAPWSRLLRGDVRKEDDVRRAVETVQSECGRIDVAINSAGVAGGGPVHMVPVEEWDRVIDINLKGTFLVCKHVLPPMMAQRRGSIVNIASIEGLEGSEGGSSYNASKGAVVLLTRNLAMDYARQGIRVNAVCPGFIDTPLLRQVLALPGLEEYQARIADAHQLGRFGQPREIANAVHFLASDEASFITGHALVVDGGYTAGHRFGLAKLMGLE